MHPHQNDKRRMRTAEAAKYCCLAKSTMEKLRCVGGGPKYSQIPSKGGVVIYDADDLDVWLASKKRQSTSDIGGHNVNKQDPSASLSSVADIRK